MKFFVTLQTRRSNDSPGFLRARPLGRVGQPDDIGTVAVFLASDDASWITGETLRVAGGLT
jgi:NAD(P)-dependent dehydrogenase (short-subunit alcohol dehydrogenase family)